MHRHEMQQSNIYLGIYIIVFYFFWKIRVLQRHHRILLQMSPQIKSLSLTPPTGAPLARHPKYKGSESALPPSL
jgi:hypothetical protein